MIFLVFLWSLEQPRSRQRKHWAATYYETVKIGDIPLMIAVVKMVMPTTSYHSGEKSLYYPLKKRLLRPVSLSDR